MPHSIQAWRRECQASLARSRARRASTPLIPRRGLGKPVALGLAAIAFFYAVVLLGAWLADHL
jgi:hypothetical protein